MFFFGLYTLWIHMPPEKVRNPQIISQTLSQKVLGSIQILKWMMQPRNTARTDPCFSNLQTEKALCKRAKAAIPDAQVSKMGKSDNVCRCLDM